MDISKVQDVYFIGIKGSGMCALAVLLKHLGKQVSGSDVADVFYTDAILAEADISCHQGFDRAQVPAEVDVVIYSAAYNVSNNEELAQAGELQIFSMVYPKALGCISKTMDSCAIIGTHGKTTTTAIAGTIAKALGLPVATLTGGRVPDWDSNTIWYGGNKGFIAEVCEFKNHFEHFCAGHVLFTTAELDHPDYFKDEQAVYDAFGNFLQSMQAPKKIIACGDNVGVMQSLPALLRSNTVCYGQGAHNDVQIHRHRCEKGRQIFSISGLSEEADLLEWELAVPGSALVQNALGALVLIREWMNDNKELSLPRASAPALGQDDLWKTARNALASFRGVSRRCELIYKSKDYIILDDYAHHPTAIKMTLEGIRAFYEPIRLIVDFMPHTYSRTSALLKEFAQSFGVADIVIINDIYASARETVGAVSTQVLVEQIKLYHDAVYYISDFSESSKFVLESLSPGDLFVTMGAGDNFRIAQRIAQILNEQS